MDESWKGYSPTSFPRQNPLHVNTHLIAEVAHYKELCKIKDEEIAKLIRENVQLKKEVGLLKAEMEELRDKVPRKIKNKK